MVEYVSFLVGLFATFFTLWSTVPQIKKVLRTKEADDVSKWLIISLILGLSLWVVYGVLKKDLIIAGSNSIGVALNVFLLILKLKFSRKVGNSND
jgi:MtN3 and saliva related transmembrane protein